MSLAADVMLAVRCIAAAGLVLLAWLLILRVGEHWRLVASRRRIRICVGDTHGTIRLTPTAVDDLTLDECARLLDLLAWDAALADHLLACHRAQRGRGVTE